MPPRKLGRGARRRAAEGIEEPRVKRARPRPRVLARRKAAADLAYGHRVRVMRMKAARGGAAITLVRCVSRQSNASGFRLSR